MLKSAPVSFVELYRLATLLCPHLLVVTLESMISAATKHYRTDGHLTLSLVGGDRGCASYYAMPASTQAVARRGSAHVLSDAVALKVALPWDQNRARVAVARQHLFRELGQIADQLGIEY